MDIHANVRATRKSFLHVITFNQINYMPNIPSGNFLNTPPLTLIKFHGPNIPGSQDIAHPNRATGSHPGSPFPIRICIPTGT